MENKKVLIVDDDTTICSLLETILSMENYQTSSVNDIDKGSILPLLEAEKPQMLVLDFHLSSQETVRYVKEIRESMDWKELTILMTSAIDRQSTCLAAGANDFILKPFDWQDFTEIVKNLSTPN